MKLYNVLKIVIKSLINDFVEYVNDYACMTNFK